jgi:hypothetical protein
MEDGKFPPALKALVLMCLDEDLHTRCSIHDVGALLDRESFMERLLSMGEEEGTEDHEADIRNVHVHPQLASRAARPPPPPSSSLARSPLLDIVKVRVPKSPRSLDRDVL